MDEDQKLLRKLNRRTWFTQFLVWIALFFTAVGIAAGYKNWLRIHEKAKTSLAGVAEIRKEIPEFAKKDQLSFLKGEMETRLKNQVEHLDGALKELRQIQDSTQHIAETVYTQVEALTLQQEAVAVSPQQPVAEDWSLAEVHYLLQTAIQVLTLKQDKDGAIKALRLADQLLVKKASRDLLPLRKQISQDIALVTQYPLPDLKDLSARIDQLQKALEPDLSIEQKTIKKEMAIKTLDPKKTSSVKTENEEESLISRVKKTINEAVVVRKFDKPLQDAMDDETKKSLYQLLSLRLETLRLMMLQGYNDGYHQQIKNIQDLLKSYYSEDKYSQFQKQLDDLNSVSLAPEIPDISKSLKMLESITPKLKKGE